MTEELRSVSVSVTRALQCELAFLIINAELKRNVVADTEATQTSRSTYKHAKILEHKTFNFDTVLLGKSNRSMKTTYVYKIRNFDAMTFVLLIRFINSAKAVGSTRLCHLIPIHTIRDHGL